MTYEVRESVSGFFRKNYEIFHVYKDGSAVKLDIPPMTHDQAQAVAQQLQIAWVGGAMSVSGQEHWSPFEYMVGEKIMMAVRRTGAEAKVPTLLAGETLSIRFEPFLISK
jgi:hypothetical protein